MNTLMNMRNNLSRAIAALTLLIGIPAIQAATAAGAGIEVDGAYIGGYTITHGGESREDLVAQLSQRPITFERDFRIPVDVKDPASATLKGKIRLLSKIRGERQVMATTQELELVQMEGNWRVREESLARALKAGPGGIAKAADHPHDDRALIREAVETFTRKSLPRKPDHVVTHGINTSKGRLEISSVEAKKDKNGRFYTEGKARPTGYFLLPRAEWAEDADEAERMLLEDYEKGNFMPENPAVPSMPEAAPQEKGAAAEGKAAGNQSEAAHSAHPIRKIPKEARVAGSEDVAFFEKAYGKKLTGMKPIIEYDDPDTYYSEIAKQLDIPKLAFDAAAKQFGWADGDGMKSKVVVKRAPGQWQVMIMRFKLHPQTGKTDAKSIELKNVNLDDGGKATFPETDKAATESHSSRASKKASPTGDPYDPKTKNQAFKCSACGLIFATCSSCGGGASNHSKLNHPPIHDGCPKADAGNGERSTGIIVTVEDL